MKKESVEWKQRGLTTQSVEVDISKKRREEAEIPPFDFEIEWVEAGFYLLVRLLWSWCGIDWMATGQTGDKATTLLQAKVSNSNCI
ncbi:hypothetical protein L1987_43457 [Smallanthus sonchifolius]|uniref:Uncharacterized protein n=1 Tax=Smallanthus sonchifolius TaxID=185202 RepID=A0ACB9GL43_9ASTR|nr:hypothetical protein L1987_43457 [Smallanthus sonchifolius]